MKPDDQDSRFDYEEWEDDSERIQKIRKAPSGKGVSGKRSANFTAGSYSGDRGKRFRRIKRHDKF